MSSLDAIGEECEKRAPVRKPPVLFVDFDDVIALGTPYGGRHLLLRPQPVDLHLHLWHPPALAALLSVVAEAKPAIVLTTTWLRFLDLASARQLFQRTNAALLAEQLHPFGEAPQTVGQTRLQAIDAWMELHGQPKNYGILDDVESGTGLIGSRHDVAGRLFLCELGQGFRPEQVPSVLRVLGGP
ncbi:HAD domain-containing protein [Delftia tsuruhatensis]|uniref:HAD domain-containing protein n=1 Tax=Delftia tsuruhatensis TaxID=180282 RepID=UPI0031CEA056